MNVHLYYKTQVRTYMSAVDSLEMYVCDPNGDLFLHLCGIFRDLKSLRSHDEAVREVLMIASSCGGKLEQEWEKARLQLRNDLILNAYPASQRSTAVSRKALDAYWRCEELFSPVCFQPWRNFDKSFREAVIDLGIATAREEQADTFLRTFFRLRDQMRDTNNNPYFDHGDHLRRLLVPSWGRR